MEASRPDCAAARGGGEQSYDLVYRVEEERAYMPDGRRAEHTVVAVHNQALEAVEPFSHKGAYNRSDEDVLIRGAFHACLYAEFPSDGGDCRGI